MTATLRILLLALAEFFIAAGAAVTGAMVQAGGTVTYPSAAVFVLAALLGVVAAWREVKKWVETKDERA